MDKSNRGFFLSRNFFTSGKNKVTVRSSGFLLRPGVSRLVQGEEGAQQPAFLQLLHPHELQDQKSRHQAYDVGVGFHT